MGRMFAEKTGLRLGDMGVAQRRLQGPVDAGSDRGWWSFHAARRGDRAGSSRQSAKAVAEVEQQFNGAASGRETAALPPYQKPFRSRLRRALHRPTKACRNRSGAEDATLKLL